MVKKFIIMGGSSSYTTPQGNRQDGEFLLTRVSAYYHADYHSGDATLRKKPSTVEHIITTLKNQFGRTSEDDLLSAKNDLISIIKADLPQALSQEKKGELTVVSVPRAKAEETYQQNQLLFKESIKIAVHGLQGFEDGTDYIIRHTDTRTTHMNRSGHGGSGDLPYPGITQKTCTISDKVKGKNILLIDDLYTAGVNIDEDAIQALLYSGATSVVFYSLGKTVKNQK